MRSLPTILLSLLALAVTSLAVLQIRVGNLDLVFGTPPRGTGEVLYDFPADRVTQVSLRDQNGHEVTLEKKGGSWRTITPWNDLADTRMVKTLIDFSRTLVIEDVRQLGDFEKPEDAGLGKQAIEIVMRDAEDKVVVRYSLGKHTPWRSLDAESGNSYPTVFIQPTEKKLRDHLYVCADIPDQNVRQAGIRTLMSGDFALFRDHRAFHLSPLAAAVVRVSSGKSELLLQRNNLKPDAWKMKQPLELATNPETVEKLLGGLTALTAVRVLDSDQVKLPKPTLENLARRIELRFFQPDGSISDPPTELQIYPPEKTDSAYVFARIAGRDAILALPRTGVNSLAALPTDVNSLRNQTLTSLSPADFKALKISGHDGRQVDLALAWNPHERANRWMFSTPSTEQNPANETQVASLFTALCKTPVADFVDDAATKPEKYGLNQPNFTLELQLANEEKWNFKFGQKSRTHFYATLASGGKVIEITESAYQEALAGETGVVFSSLENQTATSETPPYLDAYGLGEKAQKIVLPDNKGTLLLGRASQQHFYAQRDGTARVVEISPDMASKIAVLSSWQWKELRPWSLVAFEIRALHFQRLNAPDTQLSYRFFTQEWQASVGGKDVTAQLNVNRANRFLEFLETLQVHSWLGPNAPEASQRLQMPNLTLTIFVEELAPDGTKAQLQPITLKIAQIQPGTENKFFYGSLSTTSDHFILDLATVQRLAENFFE